MSLEACIKKITHLHTLKDETLAVLSEYIEEYKKLKEELRKF